MKKYTAYHFSRNDDRLGHGDGRKIVLGETLSVDGKPKLCEHGLHGSIRLVDALGYASGSHLWVVEIWGKVDVGDDKICGNNRRAVVQYGDVLPLIAEFAYWCADRAAKYAAESAEYAAESAKYAEYAAEYAAESAAEYAAALGSFAKATAALFAISGRFRNASACGDKSCTSDSHAGANVRINQSIASQPRRPSAAFVPREPINLARYGLSSRSRSPSGSESFHERMNAEIAGLAHRGLSECGSPAIHATASIAQTPSSRLLWPPLASVMPSTPIRASGCL
jgi:hypothetical protein